MRVSWKLKGFVIDNFRLEDGVLRGELNCEKSIYFKRLKRKLRKIVNKINRIQRMISDVNNLFDKLFGRRL